MEASPANIQVDEHGRLRHFLSIDGLNRSLLTEILLFGGILMIMPIVYMLSTSLKWPHEVYDVNLIPKEPTLFCLRILKYAEHKK